MPQARSRSTLDLIENFPAFGKARLFLQQMIREHDYQSVADVGGGANPLLDDEFIATRNLQYFLIDRSASELRKARSRCGTIEADAAGSDEQFRKDIAGRKFDLIFSHMFLEHIADPLQAHRNFYAALNPGGRCVHIYPSPNNLPLLLNRWLPETWSARLVKFAQPGRDFGGAQRKFKAYYRMCGAPGPALWAAFEGVGYSIVQHTGYIGHDYYERLKPAALLEKQLRKLAHRFQLPLTAGCLLVLEKRA